MMVLTEVLVLSAAFAEAAASDEARCNCTVVIERIRYEGNDRYAFIISVTNNSSNDVLVRGLEEQFSVQTGKGWAPLRAVDHDENASGFLLPAGRKMERVLVLGIPLSMPDLFRTFEGDISLSHKFALKCANRSGKQSEEADEVYYWITPRTSKWIMREGM